MSKGGKNRYFLVKKCCFLSVSPYISTVWVYHSLLVCARDIFHCLHHPHISQIPNFQSVPSHASPSCHGNVYTILSPTLVSYSKINLQISNAIMLSIYVFHENWCKEGHAFLMGVNGITIGCVV